jgi:putative SOS response-associated peptidase YedK
MCGRYTLLSGDQIIEVVPNVTIKEDLREKMGSLFEPRYNIAPSQEILVVSNREENGHLLAEPMKWGLVPFWAKDPAIGNKMINARAETIATKPAFRKSLERRRCIIPADGFYEWQTCDWGSEEESHGSGGGEESPEPAKKRPAKKPAPKIPMYIHMKDGHPFAFAGLWETWQDPDGKLLKTCTIITTHANDILKPIHNRMPVILPPEAVLDWLDPHDRPAEELLPWLKPYPAEEMEAYPVSRGVNNVKNDSPDFIRKAPQAEPPAPHASPSSSTRKKRPSNGQESLF